MVLALNWQILMHYNQSLRTRITISFFLFSIMISWGIALVVNFSLESIESTIIEESLEKELHNFIRNPEQVLGSVSYPSATITRYYTSLDDKDWLPVYLQLMPMGLNELELNEENYYVQAGEFDNAVVYIVKDITDFEAREVALQLALIAICIVAPLLAWWIGRALSGQVIEPVANLARQLSQMPADSRNAPRVSSGYARDEVGILAQTFDQYLERMEQFITREQEFTGNASHELRTPLAIIQGAAELLMENSELPDRAREQASRIYRSSQRMTQMVEVLLMLARSGSDNELNPQCGLQDVVDEVVDQQRNLLGSKPVSLHCQIAPVSVRAPKALLSIAISNLLRNAMVYTERGEIRVEGDQHAITVSDTGPGISEEEQQRIFLRHYRGKQSSGSGIGLSIVRRICERFDWRIEIQSHPGRGTAITLHFEY